MQFQTLPVSYLLKSEGWNTLATATLYCGVATTKPPGSYAHAHRPNVGCVRAYPLYGRLSQRGLNPIKLAHKTQVGRMAGCVNSQRL